MFGTGIHAPTSTARADWIAAETRTAWWTVGALVPNVYERYAKVRAPEPADDWWDAYRALFDVIGAVGRGHTTTEQCSFAVWEGHGYDVTELHTFPRVDRPHRSHFLLRGTLAEIGAFRYPGWPDDWRNPDLWWPDDRSWFVATDVDFWSLYIGGSRAFVADLAASVPTAITRVRLDDSLEIED